MKEAEQGGPPNAPQFATKTGYFEFCWGLVADLCLTDFGTLYGKTPHTMHRQRSFLAAFVTLSLASCSFFPEKVSWNDTRLAPMLKAIDAVDRSSLGFTSIDRTSTVRLENRPRAGYDAMLHINGHTSRTIAFRKTPEGYKWIHEQETYSGPRTYTTVDGTFHEQIVVTYGTEAVSGHAPNKLHVQYFGEDSRLTENRSLALEQVRPIIAEWNKAK